MTAAGQKAGAGVEAWLVLALLVLLSTFAFIDRNIISLLVEPLRRDLGISDFQISLLQGASFGVLFALATLPMGWIVDRYPRRLVILCGGVAWSVASASCGLTNTFLGLVAARALVGVAEATLGPAAYSLIADLFPRRRLALASSIFAMAGTFGVGASLLLGGLAVANTEGAQVALPFVGELKGWQLAFILTGLPGAPFALMMLLVREPRRGAREAGTPAATATAQRLWGYLALHKAYYVCHFIGFGLILMLGYVITSWFPSFLHRHYGMPIGQVGIVLGGCYLVTGVCGNLISGWLSDLLFHRGVRSAPMVVFSAFAAAMTVAAVLAFVLATSVWISLALGLFISLLVKMLGPATAHLQLTTPPAVGSSRVDLQACKLEYSIVSPK